MARHHRFQNRANCQWSLRQVRQQQWVEWLRKQTEEEVLHHLFANEDFDRYYRQTLLAVKTIRSHRARPAAAE
ncbi:hypothetical protein ACLK19_19495 [Escherichia coli]